jgi:hypothetical protein
MAKVPEPAIPPAEEPWVLSQEPGGAWRALINLRGEWVPLGYFGAREDAEETIAECMRPGHATPASA